MDVLVGLVILVLFGITCAEIAAKKGRSSDTWFLFGFLFGPFALIAAVVIPKDKDTAEKESIQSGEVKQCPYCAELIKTAAIKCRYCGEDLLENQLPDSSNIYAAASQKQSGRKSISERDSSGTSDEKPA